MCPKTRPTGTEVRQGVRVLQTLTPPRLFFFFFNFSTFIVFSPEEQTQQLRAEMKREGIPRRATEDLEWK